MLFVYLGFSVTLCCFFADGSFWVPRLASRHQPVVGIQTMEPNYLWSRIGIFILILFYKINTMYFWIPIYFTFSVDVSNILDVFYILNTLIMRIHLGFSFIVLLVNIHMHGTQRLYSAYRKRPKLPWSYSQWSQMLSELAFIYLNFLPTLF